MKLASRGLVGLLVCFVLGGALVGQAFQADPAGPSPEAAWSQNALERLPLHFVENRGVYSEDVAYFVQGAEKALFFTRGGLTILLRSADRSWTVKLDFVGADPDVDVQGKDPRSAVFSYFHGSAENWKAGNRSFGKLVYADLWPGIDLIYRGTVNELKYAFVVKPGADPSLIRLRYRGADRVFVTPEGALRVETPAGSFEDAPPLAFQERDGRRVPVEMSYSVEPDSTPGETRFGFTLGTYDSGLPLILDPAVLVYCGYIGGTSQDLGFGIAVDAAGDVYLTGNTASAATSFPVQVGPSLTNGGGKYDAFVAKVNSATRKLVYCGFIGGTGDDQALNIAVDSGGAACVCGYTDSTPSAGFPVKAGPGLTYGGGAYDTFVAKVNPAGTALVYCGYIGGSQDDRSQGIALDAAGNAYVTGLTSSSQSQGFPVLVGPFLTHGGGQDAYVAKVNPTGTLVYCGYIGGSGSDFGYGVAVDATGNAFVGGSTTSTQSTFPVRVGPDLTFNDTSNSADGFVAKVNAAGTGLVFCGYIGGANGEGGGAVAADANGDVHICGITQSDQTTFPVVVGPFLTHSGGYDAFVAHVANDGSALLYCGYIGGSARDNCDHIAVDAAGNAYVAGFTDSDDGPTGKFPVTMGPDLTYNGGRDAYLAKVSKTGQGLLYCGYIGGSSVETCSDITVDQAGNAYVGGYTGSHQLTFPVLHGPGLNYQGGQDAFVAKVSHVYLQMSGNANIGSPVNLTLTASDDAGLIYVVGSSFGPGPIPVGTRQIGLSLDPLLFLSVSMPPPGLFVNYSGTISAQGTASAVINIPNIKQLSGIRIYTAFVTLSPAAPQGVKSISNTAVFSIP